MVTVDQLLSCCHPCSVRWWRYARRRWSVFRPLLPMVMVRPLMTICPPAITRLQTVCPQVLHVLLCCLFHAPYVILLLLFRCLVCFTFFCLFYFSVLFLSFCYVSSFALLPNLFYCSLYFTASSPNWQIMYIACLSRLHLLPVPFRFHHQIFALVCRHLW